MSTCLFFQNVLDRLHGRQRPCRHHVQEVLDAMIASTGNGLLLYITHLTTRAFD